MSQWDKQFLLPYMQSELSWQQSGYDRCAPEVQPFREMVAPGLHVLFTRDSGEAREFLRVGQCRETGIEPYELLLQSLTNLQARIGKVERIGRGPAYMLRANGADEACLLLLAQFWDELAVGLRGELLVAVPAQAVLLFCDSAADNGETALRAAIRAMSGSGSQRLSDDIYVRRQQRWQRWQPASAVA